MRTNWLAVTAATNSHTHISPARQLRWRAAASQNWNLTEPSVTTSPFRSTAVCRGSPLTEARALDTAGS